MSLVTVPQRTDNGRNLVLKTVGRLFMASSSPIASILSTGRDAALLSSRNAILRSKGYAVVPAVTSAEIVDSFFSGDFDLVILCHSIPAEERRKIVRLVRNHAPSTAVVVLSSHDGQPPDHHAIRSGSDPQEMLDVISSAVPRRP